MENNYALSPERRLTAEEKSLIWKKPPTHIQSAAERRICEEVKSNWHRGEMKISNILLEGDAGSGKTQLAKALSADFGLPYTKITCFADMDKSDVLGAVLPIMSESGAAEYRYYPSEIVRAFENGWLLEIQEPTVIRDAAVLMALNSALEPGGAINLPTRIVRRHPDFIAVITTNRGYNGCRLLNEALRDRVQHCEKMDLPEIPVMAARAAAKTGCTDNALLELFAEAITLLDKTAKANAIKGAAGMRSYFFWADAAYRGADVCEALYSKVIYKITTDPGEIKILEGALATSGVMQKLESFSEGKTLLNGDVMEIRAEGRDGNFTHAAVKEIPSVLLKRSSDSEGNSSAKTEKAAATVSTDTEGDGCPIMHELQNVDKSENTELEKKDFRKQLNVQARKSVKGSCHEGVRMIVHRPEAEPRHRDEYGKILAEIEPVVGETVRKLKPLLEHEVSEGFASSRVYGTKFNAEKTAYRDLRYFSRKNPPDEEPSLAVALRIDESASMNAFGRIEAAKKAAAAVYELCGRLDIPLLIYGDTADCSAMEQMSVYSYIEWENPHLNDKSCLMTVSGHGGPGTGHSNNRDGMALRVIAERLLQIPRKTRLLISVSDGQPNALPDYYGEKAMNDMQGLLTEYGRKGVLFLSAAIGHDKEAICGIYGRERFIDISDLKQLPARLISVIGRYL